MDLSLFVKEIEMDYAVDMGCSALSDDIINYNANNGQLHQQQKIQGNGEDFQSLCSRQTRNPRAESGTRTKTRPICSTSTGEIR
jgi:hypothetical protein